MVPMLAAFQHFQKCMHQQNTDKVAMTGSKGNLHACK